MSFWVQKNENDGKSHVYSVSVPIELIMVFVALAVGLIAPRYINDSLQLGKDSLKLSAFGCFFIVIAKLSLFRKRIWNSWGSKLMKKPFALAYKMGYFFVAVGVLGTLFFLLKSYA